LYFTFISKIFVGNTDFYFQELNDDLEKFYQIKAKVLRERGKKLGKICQN